MLSWVSSYFRRFGGQGGDRPDPQRRAPFSAEGGKQPRGRPPGGERPFRRRGESSPQGRTPRPSGRRGVVTSRGAYIRPCRPPCALPRAAAGTLPARLIGALGIPRGCASCRPPFAPSVYPRPAPPCTPLGFGVRPWGQLSFSPSAWAHSAGGSPSGQLSFSPSAWAHSAGGRVGRHPAPRPAENLHIRMNNIQYSHFRIQNSHL